MPQLRYFAFVLMLFFALSSSDMWRSVAWQANAETADAKQVKVLSEGYLSNRESFPFLTCKFRYTIARAESIDRALRGEFRPGRSFTAEVTWVVDSDSVLYDQKCDPQSFKETLKEAEEKAARAGSNQVTMPLMSDAKLMNDQWKLSYVPAMKSVNILSGDKLGWEIEVTPFSMASMGGNEKAGPGKLLKDCLSGRFVCRSITSEALFGRTVVVPQVDYQDNHQIRYWLDSERGFLPLRGSLYNRNGEEYHRAYWTDIRKCSGDRWFPWRAVSITNPERKTTDYGVKEIKVLSLDVDNRPPRSAFQLEIAKGTQVSDRTVPLAFFRTSVDQRIGLDDLPKFHQKCLDAAVALKALYEELEGQQKGGWPFGVITGVAAGLLLLIGCGVWYYRRRGAKREPASSIQP